MVSALNLVSGLMTFQASGEDTKQCVNAFIVTTAGAMKGRDMMSGNPQQRHLG